MKKLEFTCSKTICALVRCKRKDLPQLRTCMDSIDKQLIPPSKKMVLFVDCEEPEWFSAYPAWDFAFGNEAKTECDIVCWFLPRQMVDPWFFFKFFKSVSK